MKRNKKMERKNRWSIGRQKRKWFEMKKQREDEGEQARPEYQRKEKER